MNQKISYQVALGGIVSALSLLCMFLTGMMPVLYLALPMIAGAILIIMVMEINVKWAWLTYLAVSLLSLFVTFDKQAALIFILLFGQYPVLKQTLDRIKPMLLRVGCKLLIFIASCCVDVLLTVYMLGEEELLEEFSGLGSFAIPVVGLIAVLIFLMYDYSLGGLVTWYTRWFKPKILGHRS